MAGSMHGEMFESTTDPVFRRGGARVFIWYRLNCPAGSWAFRKIMTVAKPAGLSANSPPANRAGAEFSRSEHS